jgi:gas vesicle protein
MSENQNNMSGKDFLLGAVIGGIIGATTALLLAPKQGKELREDLNRQYSVAKDKAQDWSAIAKEKSSEWASVVKERSGEMASTVKDVSGEVASAVKDISGDVSSKAKERFSSISLPGKLTSAKDEVATAADFISEASADDESDESSKN